MEKQENTSINEAEKEEQEQDPGAVTTAEPEVTATVSEAVSTGEAQTEAAADPPVGEPLFNQVTAQESKAKAYTRPVADTFSAKVMSETESVQRAKFPLHQEEETRQALGKIEYLKDVDLEASVELGNAVLTVEKIIGLNVGSIIELNQSVGDQIRLLINGNPYAYGEVVVIGDKFGVCITRIIHE